MDKTQVHKLMRGLLLSAVMSSILAGCVSTRTGGFDRDQDRALELSVQLARQYIAQRDWESAQRHLRNALDIEANNSDVHSTLAMVYQNTGELERAEEHFRRALRLSPRNAQARNNYAVFLYEQDDLEGAERELEKVVENLDYERRAEAFLNLGIVRQERQDWTGSRQPLERSLLMDKRNATTAIKLARTYFELGEYALAQEAYDQYRAQSTTQSAEALWLGIRLADRYRDRDAFASYALALRNLYPKSREYLAFREHYGNVGSR